MEHEIKLPAGGGAERRNSYRSLRFLLAALLIAAMGLACLSCGEPSFPKGMGDAIEETVEKTISENGIPGAIVGVKIRGKGEIVIAKGEADVENGRAIDPVDRVRIGSITKTFSITALLQLVDDGKVGLNDPLSKYFSEVPNSENITIRQLANMTSGLFDYTAVEVLQEALVQDPDRKWEPEELVRAAISHEPYFPPGEGFHYSNTNTILIGMIIEKVTGKSLDDVIDSGIVDGLSLENTYFATEMDIEGRHSHGYGYEKDLGEQGGDDLRDITDFMDPSFTWAAGAVISNLEDMETWAKALATGELLSGDTQAERLEWVEGDISGTKVEYGLGIGRVKGFIGHAGDVPGYSSAAFYHPGKEATIVVFLNKDPNEIDTAGLALFINIADIVLSSGD